MTEHEEQVLRKAVNEDGKTIVWWPLNDAVARPVVRVQRREDEPSLCAVFRNGEYVAMYNVELDEFKQVVDI